MKVTKKATAEFVRRQLATNERWAKEALLKIYARQTAEEQQIGDTRIYNNIGFSGVHGQIMSSLAKQLKFKGWLSGRQMEIVFKIIPKYTRQIIEISDPVKLHNLVAKNF